MDRKLTHEEILLVELIYIMAAGTGIEIQDLKAMLQKPMSHKNGKNCLECIETEGRVFINELITFLNETES